MGSIFGDKDHSLIKKIDNKMVIIFLYGYI